LALTAVVRKIRSPQTIGLDRPMPGIGVLKRTPSPVAMFQAAGAPWPSPIPEACGPRNCGHGRGAAVGSGFISVPGAVAVRSGVGSVVTTDIQESSPPLFTRTHSMLPPRPPKTSDRLPSALSNRSSSTAVRTVSVVSPGRVSPRLLPRTVTVASFPASWPWRNFPA
jgi:hypothetical protein